MKALHLGIHDRIDSIDALRFIAVSLVLLYHFDLMFVEYGYLGVDLFFVISGFAISLSWQRISLAPSGQIATFLKARWIKLVPPLVIVIVFTIGLSFLLQPARLFIDMLESVPYALTFSSNLYFAKKINYFDFDASLKYLLHTWSLGVEVQFYISFIAAIIVLQRLKKKTSIVYIALISFSSFFLFIYFYNSKPNYSFYLPVLRLWEFILGCIGFQLFRSGISLKLTEKKINLLNIALIAAIGYIALLQGASLFIPIIFCIFSFFLVVFAASSPLFFHPALVFLGRSSYSIYLIHYLFSVSLFSISIYPPEIITKIFFLIISIVFGSFFYFFVERNLAEISKRHFKSCFTSFSIIKILLVFLAIYLNGMQESLVGGSVPFRHDGLVGFEANNKKLQVGSWANLVLNEGERKFDLPYSDSYEGKSDDCSGGIAIFGNSHSKDFFNFLLASDVIISKFCIERFGVQIHDLGSSQTFDRVITDYEVIVFASRYTDSRDISVIDDIVKRNPGKRFVVVKNIFEWPEFLGNSVTYADLSLKIGKEMGLTGEDLRLFVMTRHREMFDSGTTNPHVRQANSSIDQFFGGSRQVLVLDRSEVVCPKDMDSCVVFGADFEKVFYDYGHTTLSGSTILAQSPEGVAQANKLLEFIEDEL